MARGICFFRKGGQRRPLSTGRRKRGTSRPRSGDQHSRRCSRQAEQAELAQVGQRVEREGERERTQGPGDAGALQAMERRLDFISRAIRIYSVVSEGK